MRELAPGAGLLDTSVLVAPRRSSVLPRETLISTISLAELSAGPHAIVSAEERKHRQMRLRAVEAGYESLPFDRACASAYGRLYSTVAKNGRKVRGRRAIDLLIAATALAHRLPLYTYNTDDFRHLTGLLEIVDCRAAAG